MKPEASAQFATRPLDLLRVLIQRSGLRGEPQSLATAAPHMATALSPDDYVRTLRNLDLSYDASATVLAALNDADCPCLFLPTAGAPFVVIERLGRRMLVLAEGQLAETWRDVDDVVEGVAVRLNAEERLASTAEAADPLETFRRRFRETASGLLTATLANNLLAFATPLLVMTLYDKVIPSSSVDLIASLSIGVIVVFISDFAIRAIRARAIAETGAALERDLGLALFRKLSRIPLSQIEATGVQRQLARLRQFESMREFFTGPVLSSLLDLPFVALFLAAAFVISPLIGLLVLGVACVFFIAALLSAPILRARNGAAAASRAELQKLLFEVATMKAEIQRLGAEPWWRERTAAAARAAGDDARRAKNAQLITTAFGQGLMAFAGVSTVAIGASAALSGAITFGGLIALMAIVWRILGPLQALLANASKIDGLLRSREQIGRVLSLREEFIRGVRRTRTKAFEGLIEFDAVSHRFRPEDEPALSNVGFKVRSGELVMLCGDSGSGKTTLFNMIARLYSPTAGRLRLDGVDYRQIAVDDLRSSIAYVRQTPEFFFGTIAQNLRLASPVATDDDLRTALRLAGVLDEVEALPDGVETRMHERFQARMSSSFAKSLALARGFCQPGPVMLFDEPCRGLHPDKEAAFLSAIEELRRDRTIFIVSERPEHIKIADRVLFLEKGRLLLDDTSRTAGKKVEALFSRKDPKS